MARGRHCPRRTRLARRPCEAPFHPQIRARACAGRGASLRDERDFSGGSLLARASDFRNYRRAPARRGHSRELGMVGSLLEVRFAGRGRNSERSRVFALLVWPFYWILGGG